VLELKDIDWAVAHGHCPVGTTKIIVLDDGQWICETEVAGKEQEREHNPVP
jgi:hypothetical protein